MTAIDLDTLRAIREAIIDTVDGEYNPDTGVLNICPAYAADSIMLGLVRDGTITVPADVCPSCIAPGYTHGKECVSCAWEAPA